MVNTNSMYVIGALEELIHIEIEYFIIYIYI